MKTIVGCTAIAAAITMLAWNVAARGSTRIDPLQDEATMDPIAARRRDDFAAMRTFRPGYPFWQHVFTRPDHSIAYGSAIDGRLLAVFPTRGDWRRQAEWIDRDVAAILDGQQLPRKLADRRELVAMMMEHVAGPVLNNATRGDALLMSVEKYAPFVAEWGAIYERFGVPAEIGLGQVILESGLNGKRR